MAACTEHDMDIPAADGKKIWCRHSAAQGLEKGVARKAVILSHGLTGNPFEYIHMQARDYFTERGYDVFRFAYYWDGDAYRALPECTLETHGKDLNALIAHVKPDYEAVYVCGHSYGGLTMLFAQPDVNAVSFWDSSFTPYSDFWKSDAKYCAPLDCYMLEWGCNYLIGKNMVEEAKALTAEKAEALAAQFTTPAQVVLAGDNAENSVRDHLHQALCGEKELQDIAGADHCFTKGDTVQALLAATHKWFERF